MDDIIEALLERITYEGRYVIIMDANNKVVWEPIYTLKKRVDTPFSLNYIPQIGEVFSIIPFLSQSTDVKSLPEYKLIGIKTISARTNMIIILTVDVLENIYKPTKITLNALIDSKIVNQSYVNLCVKTNTVLEFRTSYEGYVYSKGTMNYPMLEEFGDRIVKSIYTQSTEIVDIELYEEES